MKKTILITLFGISALILGSCTKSQPEEIDDPEEEISVSLHPSELTMVPGETSQLELTVLPESIMESVTPVYSSDDESVATVSQSGLVTAVTEGSTVITVTVQDRSAGCTVTVVAEEPPSMESDSMQFVINLTEYDASYIIPFITEGTTGDYTLTVDWGDGERSEIPAGTSLTEAVSHRYAENTEYTITVISSTGSMPDFRPGLYWEENDNASKVKSMLTPLLKMDIASANNMFGYSGVTSVSGDLFSKNPQITDFSECFNSSRLSSIPDGLFASNPDAESMNGCFAFCTGVVDIPENLFANNPKVTNFATCFTYSSITSIPEILFAENIAAEDFSDCFSFCYGLLSIPGNLFSSCPSATNFHYTFSYTGISDIPENLFANNPEVRVFDGTFLGCSSLSSVPEGLFAANVKAETFYGTFTYCSALTTVPGSLFAHCPEAKVFSDCFMYCGLTSIPENLFAGNPAVVEMMQCFNSTYITSVPAGLFDSCVELQNLTNCFSYCSYLTEIPDGLFDNNTELRECSNMFEYCDLRNIPEYLFANNPELSNVSYCFSGNYNLALNPNIFCNEALQSQQRFAGKDMYFSGCFSDCGFALSQGEGGTAPALWTYSMGSMSLTAGCFANVTNVTNADEIPSNWK